MNTSFWGPDAWNLLHTIAEKCPQHINNTQMNKIRKFYQNFFATFGLGGCLSIEGITNK